MDVDNNQFSFKKSERLNSKRLIDALFSGGNKSLSAYPLRVVYMPLDKEQADPVAILVSVSKRHFKRAVQRNRVKRQIREAYRKNKHVLWSVLEKSGVAGGYNGMILAFIWQSDKLLVSSQVESKMKNLLFRISESMPTD